MIPLRGGSGDGLAAVVDWPSYEIGLPLARSSLKRVSRKRLKGEAGVNDTVRGQTYRAPCLRKGRVSYKPTEAPACAKAEPAHRQRLEANALLLPGRGGRVQRNRLAWPHRRRGLASDGVRYAGARSSVGRRFRSVTKLRLEWYGGVFLLLQQRSKHPGEMVITSKASTSLFVLLQECSKTPARNGSTAPGLSLKFSTGEHRSIMSV